MATTEDTMAYLLLHDPLTPRLSRSRLTKLVYLTDWVHAFWNGSQVTPIKWEYNAYGPFSWDVIDAASDHPDRFIVEEASTKKGASRQVICLTSAARERRRIHSMEASEMAAADHVISQTGSMGWDEFIQLVYSTHPVLTGERGDQLNLVEKAEEYRRKNDAENGVAVH